MDHYKALGVGRDADDDAIRDAYRRKRASAHPDKGGDKEAFHEIQIAYETLTNKDKRARYDRGDEPGPVDGVEAQALQEVSTLLMAAVDMLDPEHDDVVAAMVAAVHAKEKATHNAMVDARRAIDLRRRVLRRLRKTGDGENKLAAILQANIAKREQRLAIGREELERIAAMYRILDGYEYDLTPTHMPVPR